MKTIKGIQYVEIKKINLIKIPKKIIKRNIKELELSKRENIKNVLKWNVFLAN